MIIKDKVAFVTGGASGLGLCFVNELLKQQLKGVTIADVDIPKRQELLDSIEKQYGQNRAIFVKVDVINEEEFKGAFEETISTFGHIDIVINCAGIADETRMDRAIDINLRGVLTGTVLAMEEYLPKHKSSTEAVIVNISSIYGLDGIECGPAYTASKHGVIGIGKSLSTKRHYELTGVKILTICPGFTLTPMGDNVEAKAGRYRNILKEVFCGIYYQPPEYVSKSLVKILERDIEFGEVWIIEDEQCYQVEMPARNDLKKIRVLEV